MIDEQLDLLDRLAALPPGPADIMPPSCEDAVEAQSASPVLLTPADPARNINCFNDLELATSLFGEWGVLRHWGDIGTFGRSRTDWYKVPGEAESAFRALLQLKRRQGYVP